jgi:outer membrane biosynthesis protein TonB
VIEKDGSPSHLTALEGAAPDLEESAAAAINSWRYKPPTCNGKLIRIETSISVVFILGE